jgi:hypothetical protein
MVTTVASLFIGITVLVPPWTKVTCERQHGLLGWLHHRDIETSFAGYHFVLGGKSWQTDVVKPPVVAASGRIAETKEYRINWRLLFGQWLGIAVVAGAVFAILARELGKESS